MWLCQSPDRVSVCGFSNEPRETSPLATTKIIANIPHPSIPPLALSRSSVKLGKTAVLSKQPSNSQCTAIPVFLTLHNAAEVIICGHQKCFRKEKTSPPKICSVVLLALAAHPTGDLFSVLDFPFLYFYRFHGSCCASGFLGFFLMFSTMKLKSLMAPGQCAAWIFFAKVITSGLSMLLFDTILTRETMGCLLLGGFGEALLVFSERKGS
ncbi:hypothetical protein E5288_WYG002938 [Bos mutus]|uniref:Uncharacterized protein n=1 Tax=Bos mutus TaxID=72004 RepID=A0A6B0SBP4_9CETA|nr:hypothetical protein [Bos mutus]